MSETKEFTVGDTFTVYTTLNTSAYENGKIATVNGTQYYTNAVLTLTDEYDPDEGDILDPVAMFPILKSDVVANGMWTVSEEDPTLGAIYFNASKASIVNAYKFDSDASQLIVSHYKVSAPGTAVVKMDMITLAVGDQPLTRIIDQGEVLLSCFRLHSSFIEPALQPTSEPQPTQAPTTPPATVAPTNPPATAAPTDPPVTLADGYYLVGTMTDWAAQTANKLSENASNPGEYMIDTTLAVNDGIKVVKVENGAITAWYPDGMDNEYVVDAAHAGSVTVYFKPTVQSAWSAFGGYFYIPGDEPAPDTITVYFTKGSNWGNTVNVYCWDDDGNEAAGSWPGTALSTATLNGQTVYAATVPANVTGIIFNDGSKQTVDIDDGIADGAHWKALTTQNNLGYYNVEKVTDTPVDTITVKFTDSQNWGSVNIYCWDDDGNEPMGEWPGTAMTALRAASVYSAEIPASVTGIVFNGGGKQTEDITEGIADGAHWKTLSTTNSLGSYNVEVVSDTPNPTQAPTTAPTAAPTTAPTVAPTEAPKNYVYLNPGVWDTDSPRYELYIWTKSDGSDAKWLSATKVGSTYRFEIPTGYTTANCIFIRENPAVSGGSWDAKWNQTNDLSLSGNIGKTYKVTGWGGGDGSWS